MMINSAGAYVFEPANLTIKSGDAVKFVAVSGFPHNVSFDGAALAAKRGETSKSELKGASREMYDSMTEKELDELASTKRKGKPEHVSEK